VVADAVSQASNTAFVSEDVLIYHRGNRTPQPEWSTDLEPVVDGSIIDVAMYFPAYDFGQLRTMVYRKGGILVPHAE